MSSKNQASRTTCIIKYPAFQHLTGNQARGMSTDLKQADRGTTEVRFKVWVPRPSARQSAPRIIIQIEINSRTRPQDTRLKSTTSSSIEVRLWRRRYSTLRSEPRTPRIRGSWRSQKLLQASKSSQPQGKKTSILLGIHNPRASRRRAPILKS